MIKNKTTQFNQPALKFQASDASFARWVRPTPLALAIVTSLGLMAAPQFASAALYTDTYTLQTSNQSMWGPGGQAAWSYNSGFQGGTWGTYAGNAPVGGGVNAISGSQNATIIPAIPEICVWGGACIPGTPAVTADTRTGASVGVSSSGRVGVNVTAGANGGAVAVTLPVTTQLDISAPIGGVFHVSGNNTISSAASISTTAPSFQAGVNGIINLNNTFSATGCFIGAGCSSSSSNLNVNPGQFSIVGLNTANPAPLSAFGIGLPIANYGTPLAITAGGQTVGNVTPNQLNSVSGGSLSGNTLSLSNNQTVLTVTADLTGIAQFALGVPVNVLSPSINLGVATISGTLLNVQTGVNLGITQAFSFDPDLQVTLLFDQPVSELEQVIVGYTPTIACFSFFFGQVCFPTGGQTPVYASQWVDQGDSVTINLATGADLEFTGAIGHLLSRTYSIANTTDFSSNTSLSIDPTVAIQAGCFDLELVGGLGGTGNQCAYDGNYSTTGLANISVDTSRFALAGFNTASFDFALDPPTDVPEPATLWLALLALLGLSGIQRIRAKQA